MVANHENLEIEACPKNSASQHLDPDKHEIYIKKIK